MYKDFPSSQDLCCPLCLKGKRTLGELSRHWDTVCSRKSRQCKVNRNPDAALVRRLSNRKRHALNHLNRALNSLQSALMAQPPTEAEAQLANLASNTMNATLSMEAIARGHEQIPYSSERLPLQFPEWPDLFTDISSNMPIQGSDISALWGNIHECSNLTTTSYTEHQQKSPPMCSIDQQLIHQTPLFPTAHMTSTGVDGVYNQPFPFPQIQSDNNETQDAWLHESRGWTTITRG